MWIDGRRRRGWRSARLGVGLVEGEQRACQQEGRCRAEDHQGNQTESRPHMVRTPRSPARLRQGLASWDADAPGVLRRCRPDLGDDEQAAPPRNWLLEPGLAAAEGRGSRLQEVRIDVRNLGKELSPWFNEGKGELQQYGRPGRRPRDRPIELLSKLGEVSQGFRSPWEDPNVAKPERSGHVFEKGALAGVGFEQRKRNPWQR